jgi:hypothetical protein
MLRQPLKSAGEYKRANDELMKHPLVKLLNMAPKWMRSEGSPTNPGTLERRPEFPLVIGKLGRAAFVEKDPEERKRLAKEAASEYDQAQIRNYLVEKKLIPELDRRFDPDLQPKPNMEKNGPVLRPKPPIRTPEQAAKTLVPKRLPPDKGGIPFINSALKTKLKVPGLGSPVLDLALRTWLLSQDPPPAGKRIPVQTKNAVVDEFGRPIPQQLDFSGHRGNRNDPAWKQIADFFGIGL